MKQETKQSAMQDLIDGLVATKANIIKNADTMPTHMLGGGVLAFDSAIEFAQSLLEKERDQMIEFANDAFDAHNGRDCSFRVTVKNVHKKQYGGNK
jgi:hypothetical protein